MTKDVFTTTKRREIDYQINLYTIKCLRIMFLFIILMWILNEAHIFIVDKKLVARGFTISCLILICVFAITSVVDLHHRWVKFFLILSTSITITVLGVTLTYHTLLLGMIPLLIATQYANKWTTFYTYLLTMLSTFVIVMLGYYWGVCDANMLLLTTGPMSMYVNLADGKAYFGEINPNPWYTLMMYYVIPRCILFTLALPIIQSISRNILNYEKFAVDMKQLSERDEMTGLYNRNKFLNMMSEEYPAYDKLAVIFMDVNNLKQVNDQFGHDKGDELIANVGRCILNLTDVNKKAYRIGGDEFVIIVENPKDDEVDKILKKWCDLVDLMVRSTSMELSAAIGYATGAGKDIEKLINQADKRMYIDKKRQKKKKHM